MSRTISSGWIIARVIAALVIGGGVCAAQPRGVPRQTGGAGITVFTDVDFEGAASTFRSDTPDLRDYRLNDQISSLRVAPGEFWEVCENDKYRGRCVVVSGTERDLRDSGWNDRISSLRRVRGPGNGGDRGGGYPPRSRDEIVLFDRPGYRGSAQNLTGAVAALGAVGSRARSAQILDGVWELCNGPQWSGRCVRVDSSVPDLGRIGLDGVVSARPLERR